MTTRSNRNKIRQWFITFPQWPSGNRESILKFFQSQYNLLYYKIAQETHEDGNLHYHIIIKTEIGISKSSLLSVIKDEYPNDYKRVDIKAVRSLKASVLYLDKEDKNLIEHPDGYVETRTPLAHVYRKALLSWAQYLGFSSIEDYENSPKYKNFLEKSKIK